MQLRFTLIGLGLGLSWQCGCDDGDGARPDADEGVVMDAAFVVDDVGSPPRVDARPRTDAASADATPDADRDAAPDHALPDCAGACARFAACGRLEEVFGDAERCAARCALADAEGRAAFLACVAGEGCGLLQLCRPPPPPVPDCAGACERIAACDLPSPFPDCAAGCAALPASEALRACAGVQQVACDEVAWSACLDAGVFPACATRCARTGACGLEDAACVDACRAADVAADPLRRRRAADRNACVARAPDCETMAACLEPPASVLLAPDPQRFCRDWRACGYEDLLACADVTAELIADAPPVVGRCIADALFPGCPADPLSRAAACADAMAPPLTVDCESSCAARALCGALPAGVGVAACQQACRNALQAGGQRARDAADEIDCTAVETCPDLVACLDARDVARRCAAHCAPIAACGGDAARCDADCRADRRRLRFEAEAACLAAADDCPTTLACRRPAPALCAVACERLAACGVAPDDCVAACDDRWFLDAAAEQQRAVCVVSAPACEGGAPHSVLGCLADPSVGGLACGRFCRGLTTCRDQAVGEPACLAACAQGFPAGGAARFAGARPCLERVAPDAPCAALASCLDAAVEPRCASWCAALAACDAAPEGCLEVCTTDPLAGLRAVREAPCVEAARRDCGALDACRARESAPAATGDGAACAAWDRCGYEQGCEHTVREARAAGGDAAVRCLLDAVRPCPRAPEVAAAHCFAGAPGGLDRGLCAELCEVAALCGAPPAACSADCLADLRGSSPVREARRAALACAGAPTCAALDACLTAAVPEALCATHCATLEACGGGSAARCADRCAERFGAAVDVAWRGCVATAPDCAGALACAAPVDPDCGRACAPACAEACAGLCLDVAAEDPVAGSLRQVCGRLVGCADDARCAEGPPGLRPGAACVAWCRATHACAAADPAAESACLAACAAGFGDARALEVQAAAPCLRATGPFASCADLRTCLEPRDDAAECARACSLEAQCGLAAPDCEAACALAPLGVRVCVADAARLGLGCPGVADCVDRPAGGAP